MLSGYLLRKLTQAPYQKILHFPERWTVLSVFQAMRNSFVALTGHWAEADGTQWSPRTQAEAFGHRWLRVVARPQKAFSLCHLYPGVTSQVKGFCHLLGAGLGLFFFFSFGFPPILFHFSSPDASTSAVSAALSCVRTGPFGSPPKQQPGELPVPELSTPTSSNQP